MGMKVGLGGRREKLLRAELSRLLAKINKLGVQKVILFGSLHEKKVGKASDIDIAIIKNTKKRFSERLDEVYQETRPRLAVDFFVYTPEEIERMKKTNYFIRRLLERGEVLYEA